MSLGLEDAYNAIISVALKSNNDNLRGLAFQATHLFKDRRPFLIEAVLKELRRDPMSDLFDGASRTAANYQLKEAIEPISQKLLSSNAFDNLSAAEALSRYPQLPQRGSETEA